ncbi:hypothetical protein [Streptomyces litmocidini]
MAALALQGSDDGQFEVRKTDRNLYVQTAPQSAPFTPEALAALSNGPPE